MKVMSMGHSNVTDDVFFGAMKAIGGTVLVDVRSSPSSRFVTWANSDPIQVISRHSGIKYLYLGNRAGGRGTPGPAMAYAMDMVVRLASEGEVPVLMCAEGKYRECHRHWWLMSYLYETYDETLGLFHATAKTGAVEEVTAESFENVPKGFFIPDWENT